MNELRVGTRGSKLALAQAETVIERLCALHPNLRARMCIIRTRGDTISDLPLQCLGGKGFFVKEIEMALLNGEIDIAVHSAKDLPTVIPDGLTIAAICMRLDPRDAIVLRNVEKAIEGTENASDALKVLPLGAVVGTSSLRRHAQLLHLRPDLVMKHMRGNIDTRLRKLDEGGFDAIVVATAALIRLGLEHRIAINLPIHVCTPAAGQGALAIEARSDDEAILRLIKPLDDIKARAEVEAERALISTLGAGCHVPVGACARLIGDNELELTAAIASRDGKVVIRKTMRGVASRPMELGISLAETLIAEDKGKLLTAG
ncbi:MAG: hydroxymethylbilane synthase [Armatimonadota bacterium]|nr:hydroxymethylbilane synthase [Armatimonadota bacterium]MCX7776790.1 hydroxymethylbilane synthase [Armatimonadota bacterium]MDW8024587.1 hydroxymethylbilane synthase [Armatimonadota bacterium]